MFLYFHSDQREGRNDETNHDERDNFFLIFFIDVAPQRSEKLLEIRQYYTFKLKNQVLLTSAKYIINSVVCTAYFCPVRAQKSSNSTDIPSTLI